MTKGLGERVQKGRSVLDKGVQILNNSMNLVFGSQSVRNKALVEIFKQGNDKNSFDFQENYYSSTEKAEKNCKRIKNEKIRASTVISMLLGQI